MKKNFNIILIILIVFSSHYYAPAQENVGAIRTEEQSSRNRMNPVFASTYLGGNGHEFCAAVAIDNAGNVYLAGNTHSLDFPTTAGVYNRELK